MEDHILKIKENTKRILELIGFSEEPIVTKKEKTYVVRIQLEDPGYLIGKQGESLEALQHLLRILVNKDSDLREDLIIVDVNSYREKKTKGMEQKARELAYKVRSTGKEIELPYLNSFERRIVHSIVGNIADVESESRGIGSERRLVIKPKDNKEDDLF